MESSSMRVDRRTGADHGSVSSSHPRNCLVRRESGFRIVSGNTRTLFRLLIRVREMHLLSVFCWSFEIS